jgi:hypothetical protein
MPVPGVAVRVAGSPFPVADATTTAEGTFRLRVPALGGFRLAFGALPAGLSAVSPIGYGDLRAQRLFGDTIWASYDPSGTVEVRLFIDGEFSRSANVHLGTPFPATGNPRFFFNLPTGPTEVRISDYPSNVVFDATTKTVQVQASDTVTVEFNGYSPASNQPPVATITAPQNGASFPLGTPITFQGSAVDREDGALTASALSWSTTGLANLGTGNSVTTGALPLGSHSVTLRATDRHGATGQASVMVTIVPVQGGRVTGTVTVYGEARAGVRLRLSTNPARAVLTNANGVFTFDDVPAGTYTLTIEPPRYTAFPVTSQSVTITAGQTVTVDFEGHIGL